MARLSLMIINNRISINSDKIFSGLLILVLLFQYTKCDLSLFSTSATVEGNFLNGIEDNTVSMIKIFKMKANFLLKLNFILLKNTLCNRNSNNDDLDDKYDKLYLFPKVVKTKIIL